jgi:hypothetical protein
MIGNSMPPAKRLPRASKTDRTTVASYNYRSQRVCVTGTSGRQAGGFDRGRQKFPGKRIFFKARQLARAILGRNDGFFGPMHTKPAECPDNLMYPSANTGITKAGRKADFFGN